MHPINVVWAFGDGRLGEGTIVRHRFLLSNEATVRVTAYDDAARKCTIEKYIDLNPLRKPTGCGCALIGL
jgi:hypothetical protein